MTSFNRDEELDGNYLEDFITKLISSGLLVGHTLVEKWASENGNFPMTDLVGIVQDFLESQDQSGSGTYRPPNIEDVANVTDPDYLTAYLKLLEDPKKATELFKQPPVQRFREEDGNTDTAEVVPVLTLVSITVTDEKGRVIQLESSSRQRLSELCGLHCRK